MASTNKTPNYNLSQFQPTNKLERTDYNSDMTKIDTAIKANATNIGLLQNQTLEDIGAASLIAPLVTREYTGNPNLIPFGTARRYSSEYATAFSLPTGKAGYLLTLGDVISNRFQLWLPISSGAIYIRDYWASGSSWNAWKTIGTS